MTEGIVYSILSQFDIFYWMAVLPIMILLGIFGQLITIKILLTIKEWNATCKAYYLTLAIADLVYLLVFGIPSITDRAVDIWTEKRELRFQPHNISHLTCKLMAYSIHVSAFISYWSLIAYALERLIAIWNPFLRAQYIHLQNAKKVCISITIFAFVAFSPILFANPYKLRNEDAIIYDRWCYLNINNEPLFVQVWYTVSVVILTGVATGGLVTVNATLLFKLRSCSKTSNLMKKAKKSNQNPEIKSAKDILILASITLAFALPLISWIGYFATQCMLRLNIISCNSDLYNPGVEPGFHNEVGTF